MKTNGTMSKSVIKGLAVQKPEIKCHKCKDTGFYIVWDGSTGNDTIQCDCKQTEEPESNSDEIRKAFERENLSEFMVRDRPIHNRNEKEWLYRGYSLCYKSKQVEIEFSDKILAIAEKQLITQKHCIKELEQQIIKCKVENGQLIVLATNQEKEIAEMKYKEEFH